MKLMAGPDLSAAREQSIPLRPKCPVADLKASPSGAEIKHTGHGMGVTLQVGELASQHQHPAAFGVDGMGGGEAPQGIHAGLTTRQFCSVLFGKSSWKDQAAGFVGDGFIGEGTPGQQGHPHALQQFTRFGIAEMEGGIAGDSHWVWPC